MRRVLVLAYYFPPLGGAGVQRIVGFVRHLPELGYESTVVTSPGVATSEWGTPDAELVALLPKGTEVLRAPGPEPKRIGTWHSRAERWLGFEDPFDAWWRESAATAALESAPEVDAIIASMSPFSTARAAARIAQELGKPWIADLRDPWALDEVLVYPTALHRRAAERRMGADLSSAAAIVMNTPEATEQLTRRFPAIRSKPVVTIPNGYDPEDFAGKTPQRGDGRLRIVHAGYVHTEGGPGRAMRMLGGSVRGYDLQTRSHTYLLRATESLEPGLRDRIEVHLVGLLSEHDRAALPPYVHVHGYQPHSKTVELLRSADLLFLPMHDLPAGRRARIVPGKTYEYLAARRPILAAVPDGDARDLLGRAGNAHLCRPGDTGCMARAIREELERAQAGAAAPEPDAELLARHERRNLTAELATLLDSVVTTPTPSMSVA
jgi:glycosyltransferase involved in cell wall biosynthesis